MKKTLAVVLVCLLLCSVSGCNKEAKIYPYSGKIPFDEEITFGMSTQEVEQIAGKLEVQDSENAKENGETLLKTQPDGSLEKGGYVTEYYRFDKNNKLTQMYCSFELVFDGNKDENIAEKCEESYVSEMTRIFSEIYQKLEIQEELPDFALQTGFFRVFPKDGYDVRITAARMDNAEGIYQAVIIDDSGITQKTYSVYGWMNVCITEKY